MHRRVAILLVIGIIAFFVVYYGGYFLFRGLGQAEAPGSLSFAPIDPRMIFHLILSVCLLLASLFVYPRRALHAGGQALGLRDDRHDRRILAQSMSCIRR